MGVIGHSRLDDGKKHLLLERFGEVIKGPGFNTFTNFVWGGSSRLHNNRERLHSLNAFHFV